MRRSILPISFASMLLAAALLGCTDISSTNLKTSGIHAYLRVTADGTGNTTASAELGVQDSNNPLTFVQLDVGDQVTATAGRQTKTLVETNLLGVIGYDASFTGADAPGTTYTIALERQSDTSAPGSTATLPEPFTLTSPTGSASSYSRADDDIVVTYDGSGGNDPMSYAVSGPCINPVTQSFSDTGTFTVPKGTIVQTHADATPNDTCQLVVTVYRARAGTLDPAYGGGQMSGVQARTFGITSTP